MEIKPGLRVVRGPDWSWGDQDGGEGCVGTIAEISGSEEDGRVNGKAVVVQWDAGNRCNYRCGVEDKYDLRIYDTAQIGIKHEPIICDICREKGVLGIRWKCVKCYDFDLCTRCYNSGKHSLDHEFMRMEKSDGPRTRVPPRLRAKKLPAKGLFANAEVIRGHDWLWGDQDGGSGRTGKVSSIKGRGSDNTRSVVEVTWRETKTKNIYRAGLKGMVDVKCKELGSGGYYYPDHLPVLGAPYKNAPPQKQIEFSAGDQVKIELEVDLLKVMQEGHGGWNDRMADVVGELGTVQSVTDSGDIRVRYPNGMVWTLNADVATKAGGLKVGDVVRVSDDIANVHTLQQDHGGWVDDMALSLGQVGRIKRIFPSGDVRVAVNGHVWTFNANCMTLAPGEDPPDVADEADSVLGLGSDLEGLGLEEGLSGGDIGMHLKLLSMLENPAVVVAAAAAGDANMVKQFLSRHPKEVNTKAVGKTAMHCASVGGHVEVVKALLEFNPDLEVEDEDGDKPLHLAAYSDEDEIAKLLIDGGAKVNSKNNRDATPMIIAAVKGHTSVLRVLANHPDIDLTSQDSDGDTALHCAVLAQKNESVSVLLEAKADPTLLNFRLFTPVHESARIGFLPALEQFIRKDPDLVNFRKDDGYTPLHLAALNDHLDVVTMLIDHDGCIIDATTNQCSTALHVAVQGGHSRIVERLVGFGSNLNIQDQDGDTPLHIAMAKDTADPLSADTPQLKKVRESLSISEDNPSYASATIACFLVQEGASIYVQNNRTHTPLQLCPPDIAALITSFYGKPSSKQFHNSLRTPELPSPVGVPLRHTIMHMEGGSKTAMTVGTARPVTSPVVLSTDGKAAASSADKGAVGGSAEEPCFLCESEVDVKLEPCNHAVLCNSCAQRAKKCPLCRVPVKTISKLQKTCLMCANEPATVTLRPCEHQFCPDCARRMKVCFECRVQIINKEGLPPEVAPGRAPPNPPSSAANCAICLTEPRNTAFLCGHQLCWDCAQKVDHCPVCRKFVTHRIQLFQ